MDIVSLVIGVVAAILGFIPCCSWLALAPAIVGLVLGIVSYGRKREAAAPTGVALAGMILNGIAILLIAGYTLIFAAGDLTSGLMQF
ncbi:MAG: hypothetical protein R6V62_06175 [Candidatus Fermentibacteraceae bacterium]